MYYYSSCYVNFRKSPKQYTEIQYPSIQFIWGIYELQLVLFNDLTEFSSNQTSNSYSHSAQSYSTINIF